MLVGSPIGNDTEKMNLTLTDKDKLINELIVNNLHVSIQTKEQFAIKHEFMARINMTIDDCGETSTTNEGTCMNLHLRGNHELFLKYPFPKHIQLKMEGKDLSDYIEQVSDYAYYCSMLLLYGTYVMM